MECIIFLSRMYLCCWRPSSLILWILMTMAWKPIDSLPKTIPVGAIFSSEQIEEQQAFQMAIDHFNTNLQRHGSHYLPLEKVTDAQNSFQVFLDTCQMLEQAPVTIFGPFNEFGSLQLQSMCEHYEIPHIEARKLVDFDTRTDLSINMYPHQTLLSQVFLDLIDVLEWKKFVIVYEDSENIINFSRYLKQAQENSWEVRIFQLQPDQPYREILWQVKETEIPNILLDVKTEHISELLKQAQQVGIFGEENKYLITSLDLHTLDLENYRHSRTNITSLRIVQDLHPKVENWKHYASNNGVQDPLSMFGGPESMNHDHEAFVQSTFPRGQKHIKSISAMIFDGMEILTNALLELNDFDTLMSINCSMDQDAWQYGTTIINYMRLFTTEGTTGWIEFDASGFRANLTFDVVTTTEDGFERIGFWRNGTVYKTEKWFHHLPSLEKMPLIKVTTVLNDPFVMNAKSSKELRGNDRYEGFVKDMLDEISKILNVRFEINLVKDEKYGALVNSTTNEWNGMIGEVLRGEADIAAADLTINSNREQAVDFTYPFMSTGISILYKKPTTKETSLWSFLSPFSTVVWICLLGAIVGISLIFFYVGRFTPYEWCDPHPCKHHEPVLENQCNMRNSFWCIIGSLMQQGSDVAPKALSTRVISAIWYFFTLIIVSSYTANLAAFLTVEKVPFPFENVEQLAQQTKIKYGCLKNGATHKFFANSNIPLYKKMAEFMEQHPEVLMPSNAKGREMVEKENGKYAFFMESATIEYITERYCDLVQVGGLLDSKGYGVATRKGSKIRASLSEVILKLQETGVLQQLKDRWWKQKGGGQCVAAPSTPLTELGLKNLGGVFVVLVVGSLLALILGFVEFVLKIRISTANSNSYAEDLCEEFKFVMSCHKSTKVLKRRSVRSLSKTPGAGTNRLLMSSTMNLNSNNGTNLEQINPFSPTPTRNLDGYL